MIRHTLVTGQNRGLTFHDSALAHAYCDAGVGLEIGAAAHNPFHLPGCLNVTEAEGFEFYKNVQVDLCGSFAEVDLFADAAAIPLEAGSQDYVISSHMLEHHPDPLQCLLHWASLVKENGIIFTIFPKKGALPEDTDRLLTPLRTLIQAHRDRLTVETAPIEGVPGGKGGHYYTYTLQSMLDLIAHFNRYLAKGYKLEVAEALETDDKVGNGICVVLRKTVDVKP